MAESATHIALFGGTFDPPHLGHLDIAREAVTRCGLDRVIFIPCHQSPHKPDCLPVAAAHRIEMLKLCTSGEPWAEISPVEINRGGRSYSWETAAHFAALHPGVSLYWILGEDQWRNIETWSRPGYLAELLTFIVFPRDGRAPEDKPGFRHRALEFVHPASATDIRARLQSGVEDDCSLLPAVSTYIRKNHLYRAS